MRGVSRDVLHVSRPRRETARPVGVLFSAMTNLALRQRDNHCFISYASEDQPMAQRLAGYLEAAGLRVWFDRKRLNAGAPVLDELTQQICNSRTFLLILTPTALTKNYVKHEVDIASEQQVTERGFTILAARSEKDLDPTSRFPALRKLSWMELPNGEIDLESARRLLLAMTPAVAKARKVRHMFVSCGWGEFEQPVTLRVCKPLADRGVRLIGDSPDQESFGQEGQARIARIMSGCTGHLMVLPRRRPPGKTPEQAYKYFLTEWKIGRRLKLSRRIFCVERAALPTELQPESIEIGMAEDAAALERELVPFHDETQPVAPYVFLATAFKRGMERDEAAREIIEHVLGIDCLLGKDYPGEKLREAIIDKVRRANLVFADVASTRDEHWNRLRLNPNACIEAGIALGARRPLFVSALDPTSFDPEVKDKTSQVPFMFRNNQVHWYRSSSEFLANIHRLAMSTRRRIISDELTAVQ